MPPVGAGVVVLVGVVVVVGVADDSDIVPDDGDGPVQDGGEDHPYRGQQQERGEQVDQRGRLRVEEAWNDTILLERGIDALNKRSAGFSNPARPCRIGKSCTLSEKRKNVKLNFSRIRIIIIIKYTSM